MTYEEGRKAAHQRGTEMQGFADDLDQGDICDIVYDVLDQTHPTAQRPSPRYEVVKFEAWEHEREQIRMTLWEDFMTGIGGKLFKESVQPALQTV